MLFWILAAVMTFGVTLALLRPLLHGASVGAAPAEYDIEVYRDQLAEIDRDRADGLIGEEQADVARAEIGRRLIAAGRQVEASVAAPAKGLNRRFSRYAVPVLLAFVPIAAIGAYLELGSPGLPQQPLAARINQSPETADLSVLVANAERHLAANPDDGRGWDVLAPIYLRTGRVSEAENAYRKAIAMLGPSAARQAGLGEAIVTGADGVVTDEARVVFQSARELDPEDPRPAFFLAIALAQENKFDEAKTAFQALAERAAADAPWLPAVQRQIALLDREQQMREAANVAPSADNSAAVTPNTDLGGVPVNKAEPGNAPAAPTQQAGNAPFILPGSATAPQAPGNPSADDMKAAAAMSTEDRQAMIQSMVETLDQKLKENGNNLPGWVRLIRSYAVLGDRDAAMSAVERARAAFPDDTEKLAQIDQLAESLALTR